MRPEAMAKHRRRGRKRPLFVPVIDGQLALGALAASDVAKGNLGSVLDQECWAISIDTIISTTNITAGDGPLLVGVAHSDYSAAEIEEWIEEASSWIKSNKIGQERARRKIRTIGIFRGNLDEEIMNDGRMLRTKLGFALEDGQTLAFWGYNQSDVVFTTGGTVNIHGKAYLRPQ